MAQSRTSLPVRLVVQLRDDMNWWIDAGAEAADTSGLAIQGLLDPRQVAHLTQTLDSYRACGFRPELLTEAFQMYALEAELDDRRVRLQRVPESIYNTSEQLFALPLCDAEGEGAYYRLVEALCEARVRLLNQTHHYVRECTADEMCEELNATDGDRYFCDEDVHVFDEINEILEWKPAEWDDSER